jgi:hypothetical protein
MDRGAVFGCQSKFLEGKSEAVRDDGQISVRMVDERLLQPADPEPSGDEDGDDEKSGLQKLLDSPGFNTTTCVLAEPSAC